MFAIKAMVWLFVKVLGVAILLCGTPLLILNAQTSATATIELITPSPTGTDVAETDEYRTLVWKDPWDMNNVGDLVQLDSPCIHPNQFTSMSFSGGIWSGQANPAYQNGHWIFLLSPGYRGALPVNVDGRLRPIDPKVYTQLTIKMYIDPVDPLSDPGARIFWTRGDVGTIGNVAENNDWGESNYIRTYSGWHIYTIDLTKIGLLSIGNGKMNWTDATAITGLRIDPANTLNGKDIRIDWIRLSPKADYDIVWSSTGTNPASKVSIALDANDRTGNVPIHIYTNNVQYNVAQEDTIPASANAYSLPASLPPGEYTLHASIDRSSDSGLWLVNAKPILTFTTPSMTSGTEYASDIVGDPWDFENIEDISETQNLVSAGIENGTYRGTHGATGAPCSQQWSDAGVILNMGTPIDPNRFRYLSYRLRLEGTVDISNGWMSRITWYDPSGFPNVGTSDDIIVRDGWNEYIIDMWRADLPDDEGPGPRGWRDNVVAKLRIDPDEVPQDQTFYIDYVRLYAEPAVQGRVDLTWTTSESEASITLGYDTDNQGFDGTVIARNVTGQSYTWDTSKVAPGKYYIYARVSHGINETRFYNDVPLNVLVDPSVLTNKIYLPMLTD